MNVVLVLCDPSDSVVLFTPFYFNHQMAFQMTGVNKIVYGSCDPITMRPSIGMESHRGVVIVMIMEIPMRVEYKGGK